MGLGTNPYDELAALVRRAQAGDEEAFRELYRRTAQAQYFNLIAKVGEEAAADILQEVYLIAWQRIGDIAPRSFVGYLRAVGQNVCRRYYERIAHAHETTLLRADVTALDHTPLSEHMADETCDPARVADARDTSERLARALRDELDEREREVLLLRFYQEMRIDAIAEALNISPSTVKRTIRRALDKLRGQLGDLPRGAAFPVLLIQAVENPLAADVVPKPQARSASALDWGVRAMAAVSVLAVIGCLGAAFSLERPAPAAPEVIEEAAVPTAEPKTAATPADETAPELLSMATERGATVFTIADDSGVAAVSLTDADGTEFAAASTEADPSAEAPNAAAYRFKVPSGPYTLRAVDVAGNVAEGTVTIALPPEEPVSVSELEGH